MAVAVVQSLPGPAQVQPRFSPIINQSAASRRRPDQAGPGHKLVRALIFLVSISPSLMRAAGPAGPGGVRVRRVLLWECPPGLTAPQRTAHRAAQSSRNNSFFSTNFCFHLLFRLPEPLYLAMYSTPSPSSSYAMRDSQFFKV